MDGTETLYKIFYVSFNYNSTFFVIGKKKCLQIFDLNN